MKPTNQHKFSRAFAREHGDTAAIILKYLAYRTRASNKVREDKKWSYNTLKELHGIFPYFSRSTLGANLKKFAAKDLLEIGNYNKFKKLDRTQWFHVPEDIRADLEDDLIAFNVDVAKSHGVLCGVLYNNLCHFLKRSKALEPNQEMSPKKLKEYLPYSEHAIKKGLARLVKSNLILRCEGERGKYTLPADSLDLLKGKRRKT